MITETLAQTPTTCIYGDAAEVTHLLETEGGAVQGMCIVHATEYGYPEYLVSVDDVQADEPTETTYWARRKNDHKIISVTASYVQGHADQARGLGLRVDIRTDDSDREYVEIHNGRGSSYAKYFRS